MNSVFKELTINDDEKLCYIKDEPVKLTKTEYNMLNFLVNNRNKVFSREELIDELWNNAVSKKAVDVAMSRLRSKLGNYKKHIISRIGFGYGFIEDI